MDDKLRKILNAIVNNASDEGCDGDLTVTSKTAVESLDNYLRNEQPIETPLADVLDCLDGHGLELLDMAKIRKKLEVDEISLRDMVISKRKP